ncbi:Hypothetical predicted protein, partial [Olea europaea subsp. europaea]
PEEAPGHMPCAGAHAYEGSLLPGASCEAHLSREQKASAYAVADKTASLGTAHKHGACRASGRHRTWPLPVMMTHPREAQSSEESRWGKQVSKARSTWAEKLGRAQE